VIAGLPVPADFDGPPDNATRARWIEADRAARPTRLGQLRERMAAENVEGYFGVRREHMRWLTGFTLADGEEKSAGHSGQFLVGMDEVLVAADSRYTIQAHRQAPDATIDDPGKDLWEGWARWTSRMGAGRVAVEATAVPHAFWNHLAKAAPDVELVEGDGWVEELRAVKSADEIERIAAACAVADRALAMLLPEIRRGVTEHELALRLEWLMRTGGAEALAFDVACLAGPEAALPHGHPGERPVHDGQVLLFDFGAQVEGYRSDMTRTLFVGEPSARALEVYGCVAASQQAAIDALATGVRDGALPTGHALDLLARGVIEASPWPAYGHSLGHGIGLVTHELPWLSRLRPEVPLPSPTVFSVEPGIYLEGELGVRIEDLVHLDVAEGRVDLLTRFPRDVVVVGG
jgi:Xaa-Pro aminopeptidase